MNSLYRFLVIFVFLQWSLAGQIATANWTKDQEKLYSKRHFVELEQSLLIKNKKVLAKKIFEQSRDLIGCKHLHDGIGQVSSFEKCLNFMNRERQLQLYSPSRKEAVKDLNIICAKFAERTAFFESWLSSNAPAMTHPEWQTCSNALWRQVFLTSKASFRASPIAVLSMLRKAKSKLLPSQEWASKISSVLNPR